MNRVEYRDALEQLGLSQHRAATWLGVAKRTSSSWALGSVRIPEPVAKLLRLVIRLGLKPEEVE